MIKKTLKIVTVVVTYNAYKSEFFPRCLDHLDQLKIENNEFYIDHSIIVVDSHSSDHTPDSVRRDYPNVSVIASEKNLGYAGGNNRGFEDAMKLNPDYIAVVTQDVYVEPDWLLKAVSVAESDEKIGVVQPLMLLWPDKDLINSTGNHIHFLGYGYAGDYRLPLEEYKDQTIKDIPYASGAVLVFRTKALQTVGYFDDEMWMYNEDQDMGWRMNLMGYRNVLAPESRVCHQYEFSRSISKMYFMDRNRLLVILQNYHIATLILLSPLIVCNEVANIFLAIAGGWKKEKLQVWKYFLKKESWSKLMRKRRLRQVNRVVKERQIIKRFTGKIKFQDVMSPIIKYIANPILGLFWSIIRVVIIW